MILITDHICQTLNNAQLFAAETQPKMEFLCIHFHQTIVEDGLKLLIRDQTGNHVKPTGFAVIIFQR